jgi:hypothetical protein
MQKGGGGESGATEADYQGLFIFKIHHQFII